MRYTRYAIYVTLPPGPLADFCASWLGWDAEAGQPVAHPPLCDLPCPIATLTQSPRKYGMHGTIKPPFKLADGVTYEDLVSKTQAFCAGQSPVELQGLALARLGGFLALTAQGNTSPLSNLAGEAVKSLDCFRAPMSDAEKARRRKPNMSPMLLQNLETWGYPHVMEAFKFHMTLTGSMPRSAAKHVLEVLTPVIAPLIPSPFVIKDLTLVGEGEDGMFRELRRFPLKS